MICMPGEMTRWAYINVLVCALVSDTSTVEGERKNLIIHIQLSRCIGVFHPSDRSREQPITEELECQFETVGLGNACCT